MHSIIIESIEYNGEKYYYKNDRFKKGINVVLGENKHGKTTFTYLIMYALGINVFSFTQKDNNIIEEVFNDKSNYVTMKISINNNSYVLKRRIKETIISVIKKDNIIVLPINRNSGLFEKDNQTFSDWLLKTLDVNLIKVENIFSSEHYLNFDDLFRYSYYDQQTSKEQMISDFGLGKNILKKSSQMKKFIFETLLSYSNNKYYYKLKLVKQLESRIKELKNERKFKEDLYREVVDYSKINLSEYKYENIISELTSLKKRKEDLIGATKESSKTEKYLKDLNSELDIIETGILEKRSEEKELLSEFRNAKRLYKLERKEIETLEELVTLPIMYENDMEICPICGKETKKIKGKCICGNDLDSGIYHFMYSNKDYSDILKSKVSINKTTLNVIETLRDDLNSIREYISKLENKKSAIRKEIRDITVECLSIDVEKEVLSINRKIVELNDICMKIKTLAEHKVILNNIDNQINEMEENLNNNRDELSLLEFEKYNTLQSHIDKFESMFNLYLEEYYKSLNEEYDYKIILNKEYLPISSKHVPHSGLTEIKIFFYLTMLKYSLENKELIYPKILIIDTIKDHGIDNKRIEKILEKVFEFENNDCQIIMTCGYEEFEGIKDKYNQAVIESINDSKLLIKK
ncbi:hypothetical protein [Clostridium sp. YIM B02506]|uniref:hypothetical protein n=1 Tax=Clostridium sp. YIM B02506 TaxID=2910680 RepID=UPI001EED3FB6|nr:hypothetical protein [Clostridium sp. YIM B02506]